MKMRKSIIGEWSFWKLFCVVLLALGLVATFVRFFFGLGEATNLSDATPWGLWIGFDILVGVGLSAGGFVIAASVHIFGIKRYQPIARPAILTAFLGYLLVIIALLFDLGQPWRIWHALVMWNPHSVMFEVAWCVMLYTTVLAFEFSPMLFEKLGWKVPLRLIRMIYIPLVILGVLLSTMHQSSLGALYVIAPDKLHPLWYSSLLPVLFFSSAVAAGLAMTIFESYMSCRAFGRRLEIGLLQELAKIAVVALAVFAVMRVNDLMLQGSFHYALRPTHESMLFWGEFGLGVLLPMVLFALPVVRRNRYYLFLAAILTVFGFIMNRLNVAITGMRASTGSSYFPSWMEIAVTSSIVAGGFVAFGLAVKYLNIFPPRSADRAGESEVFLKSVEPVIGGKVLLSLWVLLFIGIGFVGVNMNTEATEAKLSPADNPGTIVTTGDVELALPDDYTFPAGPESPGPVIFSHASHVDSENPGCTRCHGGLFSIRRQGMVLSGSLNYDRIHEGDVCFSCHNGEAAFSIEENCGFCHQDAD